ncbi:LBP_cg2779 family protein [Fructilactobacillus cliffordii]|uniref:LBP_cg2779 family protein n=1 Tax=Fructilactobacillus cliffordii TaxID=2940299 RepID=A0A9Q9E0I7_9LACO|nr:LBP_cg2779 family protein [Fructilactobacillus cliffordii]USS86172.1 LBP_cg2779 family protein [Fructilactobacillus cliffordii]USS89241.1 LBP_cg2779 family protein [Fructilactobacillus cliffordii]
MAYIDEEFSQLATEIIKYEEKHNLDDNQMAVALHMTVERYHDIKSMWSQPTPDEQKLIQSFLIHNK